MNPDQPGAILMLVDEQRTFIDQNDHTWVVLHKTASGGRAQDIAAFFASDPAMASTHYVIGQDGTIVQCVLEKDGAGGNCCLESGHAAYLPLGVNMNVKTVSIEHVDPATDNSTPLTDAQKAASFKLVHDICVRHNIPMRGGDASGGIIGHKDIAPLSRARCPGNYPWQELFAYLANGGEESVIIDLNTPKVSNYFELAGPNQWRCKSNGKIIQHGILAAYQKYGNSSLCGLTYLGLPMANEVAIAGHTNCWKQFFERGVLLYDAEHQIDNPPGSGPVYSAHLYNGGPGQDPAVTSLQKQVTDQQTALTNDTAHIADLQEQLTTDTNKITQLEAEIAAQPAVVDMQQIKTIADKY